MHVVSAPAIIRVVEMLFVGLGASFIGSMVGLGGGFLAVPILRVFFHFSPALTAGTSLMMVVANVGSASIAFGRQGRIDRRIGLWMGLFGMPGSVAGAYAVTRFPAPGFDVIYAGFLAYFAYGLLRRGHEGIARRAPELPWSRPRAFFDRIDQVTHHYRESPPVSAIAGLAAGFMSSFFGIGGSIVAVPVLLRVFVLPPHVVSATAHFIVLLSSPFGVAAHIQQGDVDWAAAIPLSLGALVGAQFGAEFSRKLSSAILVRTLAITLLVAAASLAGRHLIR